jgi:hypothetical protein
MVILYIPCLHTTGQAVMPEVVTDYYPLSKQEIKELLDMAKRTESVVRLAQIQVRLTQGIKGMTCPRPRFGSQVSLIEAQIGSLFVNHHHEGGTPDLVDQFDKLLNSQ